MKKLKVVLTLLLALCCSLCMFACGGGEKNISEVVLEGQKLNFKEGEDFSVGDLKVSVYYQGDDELHELKADEYEVDSSAYNKAQAGQYLIYVIPKNQPAELTADGKDNRVKRSYYATVDHSWQKSSDPTYQQECACGAKMNSYTGLEDKISTVAWDNVATFTPGPEGKTYPNAKAPIAGENHVSYGSLVAGQSLKLTLKITDVTKSDDPTKADNWDSPLMGIRNGSQGILPREDGWIIGSAKGYQVPAGSNIPVGGGAPAAGIATKDSPEWQVLQDGTTWFAGSAFVDAETKSKWSTVVVEYDYQTDGVMHMRHTLKKYDGTETKLEISVKLPKAAYEVVVYGEFCDFTITDVEFVAGLAITDYKVDSQPTNLKQPEGKLFDTTGLKATAKFSDGSELKENNYNVYAYRDITPKATEEDPEPEAVKTRMTLSTEPLTADMYGFFIEFNGKTVELSEDIEVIATPVTGANATEIRHVEEDVTTSFEAPEVGYDYAVTADKTYIRLIMTGTPAKATAAQAAVLGAGYDHFIAFKLLTTLGADAFDAVEAATPENAVVVVSNKVGDTVDFVVGLKEGFKPFDVTFKKGEETVGKVQIDLSGLSALPAAGAELVESDFTLDAGGTYTVKYTGLSNVDSLTLATANARATVADVKAAIKKTYSAGTTPDRDNFYRASNTLYIVGLTSDANSVTVTYWLAAPELINLTSERMSTAVSIRNGDAVLASASLVYKLAASEGAHNIGTESAPVYVTVSGNKLLVYAFTETTNIADGINFSAILNVEHTVEEGEEYKMDYNVGLTINKGEASWLDENDLTSGDSTAKIVAIGTVNNTNDYDKGVILVASLDLTAIGVRAENSAAEFRFTANEDTDKGQDKYTIFTVKGDAITEAEKTPEGTRGEVQKGNCVKDDIRAYKDGTFYYGAIIVKATGAHVWQAVSGSTNMDKCTQCDYTRERVGNTYVVLGEETEYAQASYDWWAGATGLIRKMSGDFAVEYSYTHADGTGDWSNARLMIYASDKGITYDAGVADIVIDLANPSDATARVTSDGKDAVITKEFTIDGVASTDYLTHGQGAGEFNGDVVARITRVGTVLTVTSSWTSIKGKQYACKVVISNVKRDVVNVQIGGWGGAVTELKSKKGEVQTIGQMTNGSDTYEISYSGKGVEVKNEDFTPDWWAEGGVVPPTGVKNFTGNFAAKWTFDNERDPLWHQDVVIEIIVGEGKYLDINFASNNPWGGGWAEGFAQGTTGTNTMTATKNGTDVKATFDDVFVQGDGLEGEERWKGAYTLEIVRLGNTFTITQTIENTAGDVYVVKNVVTISDDIAEDNALVQFVGNPYWVDNIRSYAGYINPVAK